MYNIVLNITAALYTGSVYHVLYLYSAYYNTSPYEGYIVSVHRMVMENRPVEGSHRPISFIRSGRLDVCKSGVCGAGLNRNIE